MILYLFCFVAAAVDRKMSIHVIHSDGQVQSSSSCGGDGDREGRGGGFDGGVPR